MTRIGLMSDTHGFLDPALFTHFAECDEVWHADDFGPVEVLHRLKAFKPLRAVYGNIDGAELRAELPVDLAWELRRSGRLYDSPRQNRTLEQATLLRWALQ